MTKSVSAAILSFTEIDAGQHRSFNVWHRFDHQPELYSVEGVAAATRVVSTPRLQAHRFSTVAEMQQTQYFGYYLLSDPVDEALRDISTLGAKLRGDNRWHARHGPSSVGEVVGQYSSPNIANAAAVLPFRPSQGMFVTVHDPRHGATRLALEREYGAAEPGAVSGILDLQGVAGCWSLRFTGAVSVPGMPRTAPIGRVTRIYWLDDKPATLAQPLSRMAREGEDAGQPGYDLVFCSAYENIPPCSQYDWFD